MMTIKESEEHLCADIEICVHMITFVALWKMKKYSDSANHLEAAARILNHVIQGFTESKMSKSSSQNLYCLIVMSLSALKIFVNSDLKTAKDLCEDCKNQLGMNTLCHKLLSDFLDRVSGKRVYEEEVLITEIYEKVLFVTTFMPLIAPNTPLIKLSELEEAKESKSISEDINSEFSYKVASSKERLDSSRVSRKGVKSTPKSKFMFRPWWESNKVLENAIASSKNRDFNNERRFRSEPRQTRKGSVFQEGKTKFSPALIAPKIVKPYSRESFYTDASRDVRNITHEGMNHDKEVIMLEFNPEYEKGTGECLVQLVPLHLNTSNPKQKREAVNNGNSAFFRNNFKY